MPDWPAFAGFTGVVLAVLLVLARLSRTAIDDTGVGDSPGDRGASGTGPDDRRRRTGDRDATADGALAAADAADRDSVPSDPFAESAVESGTEPGRDPEEADAPWDAWPDRADPGATPDRPGRGGGGQSAEELTTAALLANVAVSQGLLGSLLLAGAWYTQVPPAALGVGPAGVGPAVLAAGIGLGVALYVANEAGAVAGRRVGGGGGEELREALAPGTAAGWAALLFVVLPVIAGFEELLFRGALIGAMHAGFGVSSWLLALGSSAAFAAGHGAQGRVGMAVTGTLGFVLAAAFVLTGSLLTVVVAHYLVNALEFLVHEWAGIDPVAGTWRPGG
ncbi:MAG: lysostaphin resistance A-like protein [Haloferacaceae archaeon]